MLKESYLNGWLLASLSSNQHIAFRECKSVSASCNSPRKRRDRQICQLWLNHNIFSYSGCRTIEAPLSDKNLMMKWYDKVRLCSYTPSLICVTQEGWGKLLQYVLLFCTLLLMTQVVSFFLFKPHFRCEAQVSWVCAWVGMLQDTTWAASSIWRCLSPLFHTVSSFFSFSLLLLFFKKAIAAAQ